MTVRLGIMGAGIKGAVRARIFAEQFPGISLPSI